MSIPTITSVNPLQENITFLRTVKSSKFYSSKLLNYIEPIEINGVQKTVFYSEINTNFNIGDRVFILNGNYDSNNFISKDKYAKFTDGYRVLGVDGCRIILDLDYTGDLPYVQSSLSNFIKVYHIRNQREFDYINSIKVVIPEINYQNRRLLDETFNSKFSGSIFEIDRKDTAVLFSDSIIYVNQSFIGSKDRLIENNGVSRPGYYVRNPISNGGRWIDISSQFKENRILCLNPNHKINSQIYIYGEDINDDIHTRLTFKQRSFYRFINGNWTIDVLYKEALISKLNFRYGRFNGVHNDGIFGTNIKRNVWNSGIWNSGIFVNSTWISGVMNSKSQAGEKLFISTLKTIPGKTQSIPSQSIDFSNNFGFGYNFIFDSIFLSGIFNNGNFFNCNFGTSSFFSAIDINFGLTQSFDITIKGILNLCDVNSSNIDYSTLINNVINNSLISNSKIVNNQVIGSSIDKSEITDNDGIKIIAADVWSYSSSESENDVRGILKLYISEDDLQKINLGDSFYISRINKEFILNNLDDFFKVRLPLEAKYVLDYYFNTEFSNNQNPGNQLSVSLKNKIDNKRRVECFKENQESQVLNRYLDNTINYASIDIECREFGFYKIENNNFLINNENNFLYKFIRNLSTRELSTNINRVFTNTYLHNSDIKSGYINNSVWSSSDNINHVHNKINRIGQNLDIRFETIDTISVYLPRNTKMNPNIQIYGEDFFTNDNVWINSISLNTGTMSMPIDGRYKVIYIRYTPTQEVIGLQSQDGLRFSNGTFSVLGAESANYTSINKLLINNSTIGKGLFIRTGIKNSTLFDSEFDNSDRNLNTENNSKQRFINLTFKDTKNIIKSGLVFASHFVNDTWSNGILYNSIWNGGTFNDGIAKRNYWLTGQFNNGLFIDSNSINLSLPTTILSSSSEFSKQYSFNLGELYNLWLDGNFNSGEFYNSVWAKGQFNNGKFYSSEWYSGTWTNGLLGNKNIPKLSTKFAYSSPLLFTGTQSFWLNGVVDNAIVGGGGSVHWYNGKFNIGEFTSFGTSSFMQSTWHQGDFNGGQFSLLAKWKNGNFYSGNFTSHYGYLSVSPTNPSTQSKDYGWENGKFYGGIFGNSNTDLNSIWYNGEFRGGQFIGRFWYDGIFHKGEFIGSGNPNFYNSNISNIEEFDYADSFTQSYYGLWWNGNVTDKPQNIKNNERVFTELVRKVDEKREDNKVEFKNMLWLNGTFSHKNASFISSLWLNGQFNDGEFNSSIFNPYVDRQFTGLTSNSSFSSTNSCIWNNGNFVSSFGTGSFYISEWKNGTFNSGYMSGAIWRNGAWLYGTAENIYWENGLWRNGNWNGTPFDSAQIANISNSQYKVIDGRTKQIILNISNTTDSNLIHINNAFSASSTGTEVLSDVDIISLNGPTSSFIFDFESYTGIVNRNSNLSPIFGTLSCSEWNLGISYSLNNQVSSNDIHLYTSGGQNQYIDPEIDLTVNFGPGYNPTNYFNPPRSSKLYACKNNLDKFIFVTASTSYNIRIKLSVELVNFVSVDFGIGNNSPVTFTFSSECVFEQGQTNYFPKIYDVSFVYNTPNLFENDKEKEFWIRKNDGGILRILRASIKEKTTEYHPLYNNILYQAIGDNDILFPNDVTFCPQATSDNGNIVSINFGNGSFRRGIWENGVWNNGYRSNKWFNEVDYVRFSDVIGSFITQENGEILSGTTPTYNNNLTYRINDLTWIVCLQGIDNVSQFKIGDKVSIGNIVAINDNEERVLIKDFYTITSINIRDNTISVELLTNFPIRRVEKDSDKHVIYVTNNIWLSGAFLNGHFRGIWNNGLFKGFPKISEISDSHFITGKFDGGRLISRKALNSSIINNYNTGLIQSFEFIDNNISNLVRTTQSLTSWKKYLSWIDVNYLPINSQTSNLNQIGSTLNVNETSLFNDDFFTTQSSSYFNVSNSENLKGSITYDILDSKSSLRDAYSLTTRDYKLGTKYREYDNLTPNNGNFIRPVTNKIPPFIFGNLNTGLRSLSIDGWSYSFLSKPGVGYFTYSGPQIESNLSLPTSNKLQLTVTQSYITDGLNYISQGLFKFYNTEIETLPDRYYMIKLDLDKLDYIPGTSSGTFSDFTKDGLNITNGRPTSLTLNTNVNELFSEGLVKKQFFYNIQDLKFEYNSFSWIVTEYNYIPETLDIFINNFSIIEVDKIPFFKYADDSDIDLRIKTPYFATAPFIDYSDNNFDFIGNINLTFDSIGIASQGIQSTNINVSSNSSINGNFIADEEYIRNIDRNIN